MVFRSLRSKVPEDLDEPFVVDYNIFFLMMTQKIDEEILKLAKIKMASRYQTYLDFLSPQI